MSFVVLNRKEFPITKTLLKLIRRLGNQFVVLRSQAGVGNLKGIEDSQFDQARKMR